MQVEIKWPVQITEVSRPPTLSPQTTGVMLCDGFGGVGLPDFVIPGGSAKTAADGLDRIHMIRYLTYLPPYSVHSILHCAHLAIFCTEY